MPRPDSTEGVSLLIRNIKTKEPFSVNISDREEVRENAHT